MPFCTRISINWVNGMFAILAAFQAVASLFLNFANAMSNFFSIMPFSRTSLSTLDLLFFSIFEISSISFNSCLSILTDTVSAICITIVYICGNLYINHSVFAQKNNYTLEKDINYWTFVSFSKIVKDMVYCPNICVFYYITSSVYFLQEVYKISNQPVSIIHNFLKQYLLILHTNLDASDCRTINPLQNRKCSLILASMIPP